MNRIVILIAIPTVVLLLLMVPQIPGGGSICKQQSLSFSDLITQLKSKKLSNPEKEEILSLLNAAGGSDLVKEVVGNSSSSSIATQPIPELQEVRLRYTEGMVVFLPKDIVGYIKTAFWGGGVLEHPCRARLWGNTETKLHCYAIESQCSKVVEIQLNSSQTVIPVGRGSQGPEPCPKNYQTLEVVMMVKTPPPTCGILTSCNDHASSVELQLSSEGWNCVCRCLPEYDGKKCSRCGLSYGHSSYPVCIAEPYFISLQKHRNYYNDTCPPLLEHACPFKKYPRRMHQPEVGPSYLSVLGCGFSALPWGCEMGEKNLKIESVCTIVTAEFVGTHLLLLFESLRVFAPGIRFYIGLENSRLLNQFEVLKGIGVDVRFIILKKTSTLDFWFHEKPAMMKKVLEQEANTLWIDSDAFLVSPLVDMPNLPSASFGCGVHDPRGWGTGYMAQLFGISNTGIVFARKGTPHLDAWIEAMVRFAGADRLQADYGSMEILYLDQGPLDYSITHTRGGFKLEPQWNVGWWTADKRIEVPGRPNWWRLAHGEGTERLSLSPTKDSILLDGAVVHVIHSHLPAQEKNYGGLDINFNTLIYNLTMAAANDSLLGKFAPRLARYGTHVKNPSKDAIRPAKLSDEFLKTFKKDWN